MRLTPKLFYLASLLGILLITSCSKSCDKEKSGKLEPAQATQSKNLINNFPDLDMSGLSQDQVLALTKLFNDEICPCGCPKTFAQCLESTNGCDPSKLLARWVISQTKLGAPERVLLKAVSEEISTGYLGSAKSIDFKNAYHKGNKNAAITVIEFADFECPSCKFAAKQFKEFFNKYQKDIQVYFMHLPFDSHVNAERAAISAEAAGLQNKFFEMHDLLFGYDGALTDEVIKSLAGKIFDPKQMVQFNKDLLNQDLKNKVLAHKKYATEILNIMATPTFLFNGRPYNLSFSKDAFEVRLHMEQARASINCQASE